MKNCPECNELLGTYADYCFKCGFRFNGSGASASKMAIEIERRTRPIYEQRDEAIAELRRNINDNYEYAVEIVTDNSSGGTDFVTLVTTLHKYSERGWRLVNTFTNELGEVSHYDAAKNARINSTIDQVVLIFERRVITHEKYVECVNRDVDLMGEENEIYYESARRIEEIKQQVKMEFLQNGGANAAATMTVRDVILGILQGNRQPMTAQDIQSRTDGKYSVMDILTYLQKMVEEGIVRKEGTTYSLV